MVTPTHKIFSDAILIGDVPRVQTLLQDPETIIEMDRPTTHDNQPALHSSSSKGCLEMVRLLVSHGADVSLCNKEGWTPLHLSVFHGHRSVASFLLKSLSHKSGNAVISNCCGKQFVEENINNPQTTTPQLHTSSQIRSSNPSFNTPNSQNQSTTHLPHTTSTQPSAKLLQSTHSLNKHPLPSHTTQSGEVSSSDENRLFSHTDSEIPSSNTSISQVKAGIAGTKMSEALDSIKEETVTDDNEELMRSGVDCHHHDEQHNHHYIPLSNPNYINHNHNNSLHHNHHHLLHHSQQNTTNSTFPCVLNASFKPHPPTNPSSTTPFLSPPPTPSPPLIPLSNLLPLFILPRQFRKKRKIKRLQRTNL